MNHFSTLFETVLYALSLILLPVIYIISFASHPNLLNLKPMKNANSWTKEFRHNKKLHFLHLLVLFSAVLVIYIDFYLIEQLTGEYRIFGLLGGGFAIIGAVCLAADKGALCLVPSAFDTLDDQEFHQMLPGLQTLLDNNGYIWVIRFLILLPIGFIILAIGLLLSGTIPVWQGVTLIIGMLFMINPDIDLLSLIGSCFMFVSFLGMTISLF